MRVAMITPWYREAERGNAVTVRRLERYMRLRGVELSVFALDELSVDAAVSAGIDGEFDLCHAFHAHLGGRVAKEINERSGIPYLITLTGSDVYEALLDARRDELLACLASASAVVAFHKVVAERIVLEVASLMDRIAVIPQGVDLPALDGMIPEAVEPAAPFIFLLPAGIRPVKDLLFPLQPLTQLHRIHPNIRLHIAGPVLDTDYAAQLFKLLPEYSFARYLGVVDHDDMGGLYRNAGVILNSSRFEGGMANSLLEAMGWGKPVLASDIEGNRSLVTDGVNGLLYKDSPEFLAKAEMLLMDPELRRHLGMAGRRIVEESHSPELEAVAYLRIYEDVVEIGGTVERPMQNAGKSTFRGLDQPFSRGHLSSQ